MVYNADGIGRVQKGTLYISSVWQEMRLTHMLSISLDDLIRGVAEGLWQGLPRKRRKDNTCQVAWAGSASALPLPNDCVDYVFVDPPFGANIPYSELNFLWECVLGVHTNTQADAVESDIQGKSLSDYQEWMRKCFREFYRVLKPGHWMTERGFEVVQFDDPISFRYVYETRFRPRAAASDGPRLVVAMTDGDQPIPFDVQSAAAQASRVLTVGLSDLFPQLTPGVVAELDRDDLDALFRAQQIHQPGRLGENATKDFILRHVCEVAPELIRNPADLLRVLLRRHYQERQYPLSGRRDDVQRAVVRRVTVSVIAQTPPRIITSNATTLRM